MFRSIWFWVIAILLGLTLWFGRDQISSYFDKLPMSAQRRTTNTRLLASATPRPTATRQPDVQVIQIAAATAPDVVDPLLEAIESDPLLDPDLQPTPPPPLPTYDTYVVKQGDTLYSIAKRYGSDVPTLQRLNGLEDTTIAVGQKLKVPALAKPAQPTKPMLKTEAQFYKVRAGDTLSSIARKFGTTVTQLQALNALSNPNDLMVGSLILVPTSSKTVAPPATPVPSDANAENPPAPAAPPSGSVATAAPPPNPPTPTPTPTPVPAANSVCEGTQMAAFVWGVSFCAPPSWEPMVYELPNNHTVILSKKENNGATSVYAISRLDDSPNAPLSWSMRQARKAAILEVASFIPGGIQEPDDWTLASSIDIANEKGQVSEAKTIYLQGGQAARVRVIVFNHANRRWRIVMIAPESLWQSYEVTIFRTIAQNLVTFSPDS